MMISRLAAPALGPAVNFADLGSLPKPVARYFRTVLTDGQPHVRTARFVQSGRVTVKAGAEQWRPYEATQYYHVLPQRDEHELDEGALQRYLAEAVMFPTALLPERGVVWTPIDEEHATASLTDGTTTARLDFAFAPSGEVASVFTASRFRADTGAYASVPWGGRYGAYTAREGMRIPLEADVHWLVGGQRQSYMTVRVTDSAFAFDNEAAGRYFTAVTSCSVTGPPLFPHAERMNVETAAMSPAES